MGLLLAACIPKVLYSTCAVQHFTHELSKLWHSPCARESLSTILFIHTCVAEQALHA